MAQDAHMATVGIKGLRQAICWQSDCWNCYQ